MSLVYKKYVDDDLLLGFWDITEDYDTLFDKVHLTRKELALLESFQNHPRKLEWLSVRALAVEMMERDVSIVYNEDRKPLLSDASGNISISHSRKLTSILFSKQKKVGIDIEYMSDKVFKVANKFINGREFITSNHEIQRYHLYIHWCAKEAIYKICDKQDIHFKENIFVEPFELSDQGQIRAQLDNQHGKDDFLLNYSRHGNYVVVWTQKECIHVLS